MERTLSVLRVVLPVVVLIGIGLLARRKKLLSPEGIDNIKTVLVTVCIPATLLGTVL